MNARSAVELVFDAPDTAAAMERAARSITAPAAIIPIPHKTLRHDGSTWTGSMIVLPEDADSASEIADAQVERADDAVCRIAETRVQKGIDLLYPKGRGPSGEAGLMQLVEYVISDPDERDDYYLCQDEVSAPAMRVNWERGTVSRFIGLERTEVHFSRPGFVDWDLVHVIGVRRSKFPSLFLRTRRDFDRFAKAAGRGTAKQVFSRWDDQRTKVMTRFSQPASASRRSAVLADAMPAPTEAVST